MYDSRIIAQYSNSLRILNCIVIKFKFQVPSYTVIDPTKKYLAILEISTSGDKPEHPVVKLCLTIPNDAHVNIVLIGIYT